ncbi:MAG: hypothetical protein ACJ8C4_09550 [Gemmataceae bacterium]
MFADTLDMVNSRMRLVEAEAQAQIARLDEVTENLEAALVQQRDEIDQLHKSWAAGVEDLKVLVSLVVDLRNKADISAIREVDQHIKMVWNHTVESLRTSKVIYARVCTLTKQRPKFKTLGVLKTCCIDVADQMRVMRLSFPNVDLIVPDDVIDDYRTIYIPAMGYLKSVVAAVCSAIRFPFRVSVIDLRSGKVLHRE